MVLWLMLILFSGFMTFMSYVYGDDRFTMYVFRVVFPLLTLWGLKKYNDLEAEYGPRKREFVLGKVQVYMVEGKEYSIEDLSKFVITEDEKIMTHYAESAALKRANGRGGQSIADASARRRDLQESRRLEIAFNDGESYLLSEVYEPIAKEIRLLLV